MFAAAPCRTGIAAWAAYRERFTSCLELDRSILKMRWLLTWAICLPQNETLRPTLRCPLIRESLTRRGRALPDRKQRKRKQTWRISTTARRSARTFKSRGYPSLTNLRPCPSSNDGYGDPPAEPVSEGL